MVGRRNRSSGQFEIGRNFRAPQVVEECFPTLARKDGAPSVRVMRAEEQLQVPPLATLGRNDKAYCEMTRLSDGARQSLRSEDTSFPSLPATLVRSAFWSIWLRRYISSASRLVLMGWVDKSMVSPGACAPSPVAPMPASPGMISATNEMSPAPRFIGSSSGMDLKPRLALAWLRMPSRARLCAVGAMAG